MLASTLSVAKTTSPSQRYSGSQEGALLELLPVAAAAAAAERREGESVAIDDNDDDDNCGFGEVAAAFPLL